MRGKVLSHDCGALPGPRLAEGRGCSFRYHRAARFFAADHVAQPLASRCVGFRIAPARGPPHLMQTWGCPPLRGGCWSWRCNACGCSLGAARILGTREAARLWLCSQVANPRPVINDGPALWPNLHLGFLRMDYHLTHEILHARARRRYALPGCGGSGGRRLRLSNNRNSVFADSRGTSAPFACARQERASRARSKEWQAALKKCGPGPGPHPLVLLVHVRGVRPAR